MTFLKSADFQMSFPSTKLEPCINAVFRLLDQNGDGNIEPAELASFAVDLINSITNLVIDDQLLFQSFSFCNF
jgi:Ca2+-binding EF-hand superfamily protein